ncbi:MAG: hypothetical protein PHQ95_03595 [Candidatus Gracilibacteria bacterium]|nr:hypothetical protein [Candidatus Gracilibacteria bacterium]
MNVHSGSCPHETLVVGEGLSVTDIIADFKNSLVLKESGYYPTFNEVQTALEIMLSHMRVVGPIYIDFIESNLKKYEEIIRENNGDNYFLGLNGYIRYLEEIIILPLEVSIQGDDMKASLKKVIESNILMVENVLRKMEDTCTNMEIILQESGFSADERARLIEEKTHSEILMNDAKLSLQCLQETLRKQGRDVLVGKNNTIQ